MGSSGTEGGQATNLIWCIGNANVERGELSFNHIPQHDIKALLHRGALDTLRHFGSHAGIEFYGNDFARLLEDADCQVARSRADFKNNIRRFQVGLLDNRFCYSGVLQDMLSDVGVEFEDIIRLLRCFFVG